MRFIILLISYGLFVSKAVAGFDRWSTEIESNPFSGGKDVNVLFVVSRSAQVQVRCDSTSSGLQIVAIPGFELPVDLQNEIVEIKLAVDGDVVVGDQSAVVSAFGANLAGVVIALNKNLSGSFTKAMITAKRQIAISDGISSKPFLLNARGSTKAGKALDQCLEVQVGKQADIETGTDSDKLARIQEIEKQISDLQKELDSLQSSE